MCVDFFTETYKKYISCQIKKKKNTWKYRLIYTINAGNKYSNIH